MSQERRRSPKLAQARRRPTTRDEDESDGNDVGAGIIDDSASEAPSDDELQLSASDNEDDAEEGPNDGKGKVREHSKDSVSPPTSESYDRLEDDTLQGGDFIDLAASNGSVGPAKVTDTAIMLNGFKDIPKEETAVEEDTAMHFDELDDSISFEPRPSDKKPVSRPSTRGTPLSTTRGGGARDRPDRETYWQRRNREKEEYKKRLEDPTFTPFVGEFFMHDSREKKQFDSLNQFGTPRGRGRGRGGRGFRGGPPRDMPSRDEVPREALWDHAGFEELEPQPPPQLKVHLHLTLSDMQGKAKSQTSSAGRQTPQQNGPSGITASQHAPRKDSVNTQDTSQPSARPAKNQFNNVTPLTSTQISINISLPNTEIVVKDITLNSYVGRIPYQKPLRGDRPVKISSIEGAGNREIFPSKERSWLPYFLKNAAANAAQARDGLHSRGGSVASTGTPSNLRPARNVSGTPNKALYSAVNAPTFNPDSPAEDEDDKTTKIKVNLPPTVVTTSSASPAVSDSSSLHVHHPRPTKHINIADIDDSSARLKAFLNPQTSSSPAHSHERTSSTQLPETAVHAAPFQPTTFLPTTQQQTHQQQIPVPYPPAVPYYYPAYPAVATEYPPTTNTQNPYLPQQPRYESNGMVYYYDPSFYYYQPPPTGTPTQQQAQPPPPPPSSQHQNQPPEQPDPQTTQQTQQQQMYYYHPSQMPVTDPSRSMGMYFPYQQGT